MTPPPDWRTRALAAAGEHAQADIAGIARALEEAREEGRATLTRLEAWSHGHKSRSVAVESPDGYGAGCWTVTLGHEHGATHAAECSFFTFPEDRGGDAEYRRQAEAAGAVFVAAGGDEDADPWPGLERTILCALDAFDRGVWGPRRAEQPQGEPGRRMRAMLDAAKEEGRIEGRREMREHLGELRTNPRCRVCGGSGAEPDGSTCDCYGWYPKGSARLRKELEEFARASVESDERIAALARELRDTQDNAEASAEDTRDASAECARLRAIVETPTLAAVLAEREKQRAKWGDAHDDEHADEALAAAAAVLLHPNAPSPPCGCREAWCPHLSIVPDPEPIPGPPWALPLRWKQRSRRDQLVVGIALALAELERLERRSLPNTPAGGRTDG